MRNFVLLALCCSAVVDASEPTAEEVCASFLASSDVSLCGGDGGRACGRESHSIPPAERKGGPGGEIVHGGTQGVRAARAAAAGRARRLRAARRGPSAILARTHAPERRSMHLRRIGEGDGAAAGASPRR